MSHILDHQPMDARDVASILDNLADATTEPPTFRHRKFTITQLIFSIRYESSHFIYFAIQSNLTMRCMGGK